MLTCDPLDSRELALRLCDARKRTLECVEDLTDGELGVSRLSIVNPIRWELGRVGWFQEKWILRREVDRESLLTGSDALYDATGSSRERRWELALPSRESTLEYLKRVLEMVLERLERGALDTTDNYFHQLALYHEDRLGETLTSMRQTLALRAPAASPRASVDAHPSAGACPGECAIAGGTMLLGAEPGHRFVFDNEKWSHAVDVAPFAIARATVTQAEFAHFVDEGGYRRGEFWSDEGWRWRQLAGAEQPLYWRRDENGTWARRHFERELALEPDRPVVHVNAHEAEAYCRFVGRRLPTESEWEFAAGWMMRTKREFPWGSRPFDPSLANLDGRHCDTADVGAFRAGDSLHGCRQMLGNVWEWTASVFAPYPGFVRDPDADYSAPWFGTHRVLRGGSFATRARNVRNTWRNFYEPHRRDPFAGFRTVAR